MTFLSESDCVECGRQMLIEGPPGEYICDECSMQAMFGMPLHDGPALIDAAMKAQAERTEVMNDFLHKLRLVARLWQSKYDRDADDLIECVASECDEYREAQTQAERLDEMSDVIVGALRMVFDLAENERQFIYANALMKVSRRCYGPGKDKAEEAKLTRQFAERYGIGHA